MHARSVNNSEPQLAEGSPVSQGGLTMTEWRRRFWHMSPGVLPFLLWLFPHRDPLSPTLWLIMVGIGIALALNVFLRYRAIQRDGDQERSAAVLGYACSVIALLIAFPAHIQLGLALLAILAFGDGSATLIGKLVGGPRLPWNAGKTWSGLTAFLCVGTLLAATVYWGETWFNTESPEFRQLQWPTAVFVTLPAVLAAGVAESVHSRWNDNIRVGVVAGVLLCVMHGILVGF